jgi:hypothetical protein
MGLRAGDLKTGPVTNPRDRARRETVNLVVTAVLLAGLVCLLIVGGITGRPGSPADRPPSVEPPLTNGSAGLTPSRPG